MPKGGKKARPSSFPAKAVRRKYEVVKENETDITVEGVGRRKKGIVEEPRPHAPGPIDGVVFIYDPLVAPRRFMIRKNSQTSDPIDVSQALFEENKLRKSTKDVRLSFEHSKVSITYIGSSGAVWVESKKGALVKGSPHVLKNGDGIVFGATNRPGFEKAPDAVRVKVEFISTSAGLSRSPRASVETLQALQEPQNSRLLPVQFTKSAPQARLISSARTQPRSRTRSLCDTEPKTHTDLERQVTIPWFKGCQLGHGLDALSGEHTATSVFKHDFKPMDKWNDTKTTTNFDHLEWQTFKDLLDDFEVGVGATVNVLSHSASANAKITNMLSETISTSTILVQYKHEVHLTPDSLPHDLSIREGVDELDDAEFRARYGDYYIAGYDKVKTCRMIVKCKTKEGNVTEEHKEQALALVENYLNGAIKIGDLRKQKSTWRLLSVVVATEGYSDHPNLSDRILDPKDGPGALSAILKDTAGSGSPRTAILRHYSTLPSLQHLSRRVAVPPLTFEAARVMRDTFAHLRDCCRPHPALKEYRQDLHTLDDVLERFKKLQKYLVHAANDMEKKGLMQDLQSRRKRVDMLIERYDFIRTVLDMDTSIVSHPPQLVNGRYLYRWHCGKTGGPEGGHSAQTGPFHDPSFGQCHEVFGFRWTSPKTSGRTILGLPRPPQDITFSTSVGNHPPSPQVKARAWSLRRNALRATATIRLPLGRPAGVGTELRNLPNETEKSNVMERAHGQTASGGVESNRGVTFDYYMPNQKPVYILGWTISCYWPKRDPRPSINVDHHSKHILSDRLAVSVDNAYPAQWHCTVYFVKQSEYNFSDLLAPRNKSPPSMRKPNWVQRLFGN